MKSKNLKLAIQKNGRLTEDAISFLRSSGLQFENYKQKLFSSCKNFPLEI
ncbi:ATP phosphoribosyltransferase, partial [Candidatus Roizmanbacteria bacterium CG_4_9_14_3_um_filter_33_18]